MEGFKRVWNENLGWGGRIAVIVGFLGIVLVAAVAIPSLFTGDDRDLTDAEVRTHCEIDVKKQLKAPSTADFAYPTVVEVGTHEWEARGTVEAENSFGAVVSNDYVCNVSNKTGTVSVSSILL